MTSNSKYEQLIQAGFEIIVKAFDEQNKNYENTIDELKKQIQLLTQDNSNLKDENEYYASEIKNLKIMNQKLLSSLKCKEKGIALIQNTLNSNQNEETTQEPYSRRTKSMIGLNNFRSSTPINLNFKSIDSNEEDDTEKLLDYDYEPKTTRSRNITLETRNSTLNESKSTGPFLFQRKSRNIIKNDNSLFNKALTFKTKKEKKNSISIGKNIQSIIFENDNDEAIFLKNCKDNLNSKIFEKILILLNNYKSGLISLSDVSLRIKTLLKSNQKLMMSFSKLFN